MTEQIKINIDTITATYEIPEMTGSYKQVRWAEKLRDFYIDKVRTATDFRTPIINHNQESIEQITIEDFAVAVQKVLDIKKSSFWIDNFKNYTDVIGLTIRFIGTQPDTEESTEPNPKGLNSEIVSVKQESDTLVKVKAIKKNNKRIETLRRFVPYKHGKNEFTFVMACDIYAFKFDDINGTDIRWLGNYKENVWADNTPKALKDEMIGETEEPNTDDIIESVAEEVTTDLVNPDNGEIKHESFSKILACIKSDIPVYLVGPAGSGKNHTLEQVARELKLDFYFTNSVQQEHKLTGFIDAGGKYHETEFYKAFTKGGLFFLDEMDASIPEVLVLLNAAIANGYFEFPNGRAEAHINFRVVAAGNTMGSGANEQYTGRLVLDQATLDRFAVIEFDYDIRIELKLAKGDSELVDFVRDLRKQSETLGVRTTFSYRCISGVTKLKGILSLTEIIQITIVKGLDRDTLKTFKTTSDNSYSRGLRELQNKAKAV